MSGGTPIYMGIMLLSGVLIPVMAALNADAGAKIANPYVAGVCMLSVAFSGGALFLLALRLIQGESFVVHWQGLTSPLVFAAGLIMAFYLISITALGPRLGVGTAVFLVLLGQIVAAAVIDHFGLFGAAQSQITWGRGLGLVLMAVGVFLARKV